MGRPRSLGADFMGNRGAVLDCRGGIPSSRERDGEAREGLENSLTMIGRMV